MKVGGLQLLVAVLLALIAGCIGAFAASAWRETSHSKTLHEFVHEELDIDAAQNARLDQLETRFAAERKELDLSLRAANARLASAMVEEHDYGPKVAAAIDDVHARMGDLQKATVRHVFAMRMLLDPAQQQRFDRQVASSLTSDPGE
ncbi:MAG: heavy metal resistance protein [Sphingomonadales bacterium 63-6]|nr:MAG: heavy metal resistance protein [Sphingomonadales bacterium 63-6]